MIFMQRIFDVTAKFIENIMDFREMVYQQGFAESEKGYEAEQIRLPAGPQTEQKESNKQEKTA